MNVFICRCDDDTLDSLNLCTRCHSHTHSSSTCEEFGDLSCPRSLSWDHWEDTCPYLTSNEPCAVCNQLGHTAKVKRNYFYYKYNVHNLKAYHLRFSELFVLPLHLKLVKYCTISFLILNLLNVPMICNDM